MKAHYQRYVLEFKRPSGTSRGILTQKETWFLILEKEDRYGIGECGLLRRLSVDDRPEYEEKLAWVCSNINKGREHLLNELTSYPSIQFGLEQAMLSIASESPFLLFDSAFTKGKQAIPINGLVWMGEQAYMNSQIQEKLAQGFRCIKMKIGALDFKEELAVLEAIRTKFTENEVTIRVDANGAFDPLEALEKLQTLASFGIHSIEQPIKPGNAKAMRELCEKSPVPIALDEELIGVFDVTEKEKLLQIIAPQYVILKPSLVGGFAGCLEWITLARALGIDWWITSALESNVGLNAIAQWTATLDNPLPQGLGTGGLFTNNFASPLEVKNGSLWCRSRDLWKKDLIKELCT